jgi:hypothetical protein
MSNEHRTRNALLISDELCEEIEHLERCGVPLTAVTRLRRIAERMRAAEGGRDAA